jgi:L-amino acid N-acyltransferase YncA
MSILIRRATPEDALVIAEVHVESRRAAYAPFLNAGYLQSLSIDSASQLWTERLTTNSTTVILAEDDQRLMGFAGYGANRDRLDAAIGELHVIYVRPEAWHAGIGSQLLRNSETSLRAAGYTEAILWVFEANAPARRFYEVHDWSPDGATEQSDRGGELHTQLRYRKTLS